MKNNIATYTLKQEENKTEEKFIADLWRLVVATGP